MKNIIYLKGVPTPQYRAQRIRQDRDQDLFVDMLANHPEHIARSKAKAQRYIEAKIQKAKDEADRQDLQDRLLRIFTHVAVFAVLALMVVIAI